METGIVKRVNDDKGYCFIARDGGGEDLFAHFSEVQGDGDNALSANQRVEFEVGAGAKGPQAKNIRRIAESDSDAATA